MTLAPGVHRIPTLGDFINSFAFVEEDGSVTLIDCGLSRAPGVIVRALGSLGKHPQDVQRIVLTHAHADHAGGAAAVLRESGRDGVEIHRDDAPFATSGAIPPNGSTAGRLISRLPSGRFAPVAVSRELEDADLLAVRGGVRVIHTPGHTPGHISLLHEPTGVLITGDALFNMRSRMTWPVSAFCTSAEQNRRSAEALADLKYRIVAFTHGPEIRDGAREAVRAFLRRRT